MGLSESTKNLLITIAENEPKVKQQGYDEGFEAGKQKEWSDFWDVFQHNGLRTNYDYACYLSSPNSAKNVISWTDANFKPKYSIIPTTANRGFAGLGVTDFVKILEDRNIEFDTSQCTNMNSIFTQTTIKHLPTLDLTMTTSITALVSWSSRLEKIDKIIWGENVTTYANPFNGCVKLSEFVSEGTLAFSVSFASSPLTVETMKGLISCLKNYTGTESEGTYTLTLTDTCKTALQADTETVELDGVSYTYFELITAKGWNLA